VLLCASIGIVSSVEDMAMDVSNSVACWMLMEVAMFVFVSKGRMPVLISPRFPVSLDSAVDAGVESLDISRSTP